MDLTKLSDSDLMALKANDLSKISNEGLMALKGQPQAVRPTVPELPIWQSAAVGAGKGVINPALALAQYAGGKPAEVAQNIQQRMKPFQEANPMTFGAGEIGGSIVGGGALLKGAGMIPSFARANPYLQGAGVGSVMGALTPEETPKTQEEAISNIPQKAAIGTVGGVGGTALGRGLANILAPKVTPETQLLLKEGVTPTAGQMAGGWLKTLEDKATSVPLLGDVINYARTKGIEEFNKAAYRRALEPIGGKVPEVTGREGVMQVKQQITKAYNDLLPKITFVPDADLAKNLNNIPNEVTGLTPENAQKVLSIVNETIANRLDKNGKIKGEAFKVVEEKLGTLAKTFSASADADQKLMGNAYNIALGELRQNLARNNPQYAEQLNNINNAFANYARIRSAGSMANTQDAFTPSQLAAAIRQADKSAGKGQTATGQALMQDLSDAAVSTLPSKIPTSGTSERTAINSIIGSGLGAGTVMGTPYAGAVAGILGTTALPYMPYMRSAMPYLMAKRPESVQKLADFIRQGSPFLAGAGAQKAIGAINE